MMTWHEDAGAVIAVQDAEKHRTSDSSSSGITLEAWIRELAETADPLTVASRSSAVDQAPGLLALFAVPIKMACEQLSSGLHAVRSSGVCLPGSNEVVESQLLNHLHDRLRSISERTLALELQVAAVLGQLSGDTPASRFNYFTGRLRHPEAALAILDEYPILAEQSLKCINQWVRFSLEFVRRLANDWDHIRETFFSNGDVGHLVELSGNAGDRHADGRAVIILRFSNGSQLVYKPRSLAVDLRFQDLLNWCNARGANPPLRTLRILSGNDYGWVEFVHAESCRTVSELRRFYQRQGLYLSLLYLLQATDFHFENLIAAGEHPVLVDLETLFHERLPGPASNPANDGMSNSVVSIGILPRISYYEGFDKGVDFSGLGASTGQEIETPTYEFQAPGTDEMRLSRVEMHTLTGKHRPTLAGAGEVSPADFLQEILAGFTSMYQLLHRHRTELSADDGPLAAFAEVETRFIARATQIYGLLLEQSFHPDFLRSAGERSEWFNQLWSQANEAVALRPLVAAERAELDRNDIPLFHMRPGSRDLWSASGERFTDFFARTPLETVRQRLVALGPDDFARQVWLIHAAIDKLRPTEAALPQRRMINPQLLKGDIAMPEAICIGEHLAQLAWQNDCEARWLGFQQRSKGWFVDAVGLEDGGLIEIACFLTNLDRVAQKPRYVNLVTKTLYAINRIVNEPTDLWALNLPARIGSLVNSLQHCDDPRAAAELIRLKAWLQSAKIAGNPAT